MVARTFQAGGGSILERNARVAGLRGEIDLVVLEGESIVFVEVKTRAAASWTGPDSPIAAVGPRKQAKLRSLAVAWLGQRAGVVPRNRGLRFDVVGLRLDANGRQTEYEHVRAAF
ncbi:MAG: YraN family protein [Solirubrobacterales bacterium]|nr:YraN family protein [Solirubrobacterales bacterium]